MIPPYTISITVHTSRRFRFRVWLAMIVMRLAARIMPFPTTAEWKHDPCPPTPAP